MNNEDLLDFFAGLALEGLISAQHNNSAKTMAKVSYDIAEAMINEREERHERLRSAQGN